jgi:hypothetical protein
VLNRTRLSDLMGIEGPLATRLQRHVEAAVADLSADPALVQIQVPQRAVATVEK